MKKTDRKKFKIKDIYHKYALEVYKYVYSIVEGKDDAEDIVQNTFMKAYYNLDKLLNKDKIHNWLIKVAKNESFALLKKRVGFIDDVMPEGTEPMSLINIEGEYVQKEMYEKIIEEVNNLEQPYKAIITMRYYKRMSFIEIAELLNEKPKKVYKLHEKAKEILRNALKS